MTGCDRRPAKSPVALETRAPCPNTNREPAMAKKAKAKPAGTAKSGQQAELEFSDSPVQRARVDALMGSMEKKHAINP